MADALREREIVLDIEGMTCASCVQKVERALGDVEGVDAAAVNLATRTATVRASGPVAVEPLVRAVASVGYGASPQGDGAPEDEAAVYGRRLWVTAPLTVAILVLTFVVPTTLATMVAMAAMATIVQFYGGWPFLRRAVRAARHGAATMDTLVSLGSLAAYGASMWALADAFADGGAMAAPHYFDTGAVIVTLILVGRLLESRARVAAGDASRALLARGATVARVRDDAGQEREILIGELRPGALAVVLPGEKIPADGVVKAGDSWVDLSLLTGESVPVDVGPGDEVIGASINGHGRLEIFVTKVGEHATLAEIVRLLQLAQGSSARVQELADRISAVFVPIVLATAAATFLGWWVVGGSAGQAVLHATTVVLIACPCALGLATPAAITTGTGRAAELGVLMKGGEVVESMASVSTVVFDKTGTVTEGRMRLAEVATAGDLTADRILALAASVEAGSEHPIAHAVVAAARERGLEILRREGHRVIAGSGAVATVEGAAMGVRRPDGLDGPLAADVEAWASLGLTPFVVERDEAVVGALAVADTVKPEAAAVAARLRAMGIRTALLTGDRRATAASVARLAGIDDVVAEALPADKVDEIRRRRHDGGAVAFVGDGLNDAPALAAADVGIAIGSGTDVALAAADVQLLGGSLGGVIDAVDVSRATARVIRQNLFWAFAYNVVMIPLAVMGVLEPIWAAAAMAASSLTVVLNALRLRHAGNDRPPVTVAAGEVGAPV